MAKDRQQPEITGPAASASVATLPEPAALGLRTYLVRLERHKSRVVDPVTGNPHYVDELPIDALTEGDAILKFNKLNGIRATQNKYTVREAEPAGA